MSKYKVQLVNIYSRLVEDDFVDGMIFKSKSEAENFASECNSNAAEGAEILKLSNPFDYEEDYGSGEDYEYVVVKIN